MRVQIYECLKCQMPTRLNHINIFQSNNISIGVNYKTNDIYLYRENGGLIVVSASEKGIITNDQLFKLTQCDGFDIVIDNVNMTISDGLKTFPISQKITAICLTCYPTNTSEVNIRYVKTDTLHLKPCKLLSLYGNHPAGECAMIDVLSNTLYFNQGSGSFSVEGEALEIIDTTPSFNNIISKESTKAVRLREWLFTEKGYVDTGIKVTEDLYVDFHFKANSLTAWDNVFGCEDSSNEGNFRLGIYSSPNVFGLIRKSESLITIIDENTEYRVQFSDRKLCINNSLLGERDALPSISTIKIYGVRNNKWFKSVTINNHTLHPCELALPYGAHQIGEACMIDLQSGDLYFNQDTGQFTCEGAVLGYWQDKPITDHYCDVEGTLHRSVQIFADNGERLALIWEKSNPWTEHRWLVMSNPSINGFIMETITNLTDAKFKIYSANTIWGNIGVCGLYSATTGFYSLYNNNNSPWYLWSKSQNKAIKPIANYKIQEVNDFEVTLKNITINETTVSIDDLDIDYFNIGTIVGDGARQVYYSQILADGRTLSPAILDRPTLAEEDNNGIARKQGEAVFVDEQRYKRGLPWVFGNVANSGSFSVSDYLIENEDFEIISGVVSHDGVLSNRISLSGVTDFTIHYKDCEQKGILFLWNGSSSFWSATHNYQFGTTQDDKSIYLDSFLSEAFDVTYKDGKISANGSTIDFIYHKDYFTYLPIANHAITGIEGTNINLIPVRLKKSIEPTCTHNGKGGKVGEIGFFDTISGRFYGNDGTGEFTEYVP